jgi:hypothetical protein
MTMSVETFDWGLKEAVEVVEFLTNREERADWGFADVVDRAVDVVEAEEESRRKKETAEKIRLEKARENALMVRDKVIVPLLDDLREDFAADEEQVLPQWDVHCSETANAFVASAATPETDAPGPKSFTIAAKAAVVDEGASINLSVVCRAMMSHDASASELPPLVDRATKLPANVFDEWASRKWLHEHLAESARLCVLTKMRQASTQADDR